MHRPAARRARHIAGALTALAVTAACTDDGPSVHGIAPRVVAIAAQPCRRPTPDLGTGVVIGADLVLTAAHTVGGARRTITADGAPARVVALDVRTDLALLAASVGTGDVHIGTPSRAGDVHVATVAGTIDVDLVRTTTLIVHDATRGERHVRQVHTLRPAVSPGTSGAPLLDDAGQLLGIVVLDNRTDDTAYAVTGDEIDHFLEQRTIADARSDCAG